MGFTCSTIKAGVYTRGSLLLLIWVNDISLIGNKDDVEMARQQLKKELNIKDMGATKDGTFLGMNVRWERKKKRIYFGQGGYLKKILEMFGMGRPNGVHTPLESGIKLTKRKSE
jgi:hypothetical protein